MVERLKKIPKQLLEQWNKYTSKQKTAIISVFATVFLFLVILSYFMTRTEYETLMVGDNTKDISSIAGLLESEGIEYKLGSDNLTLLVDSKKYSDAVLLIYSSDVPTAGLGIDELLDNGLSTTNSERNLKNHLYVQSEIRKNLTKMNGIIDAQVTYVPQEDSYRILSQREDYPASVALTINSEFDVLTANTVAEYVAAAIGNESTDKIKVVDQNGNLLYGGKDDLYSGTVNSVLDYREKLQNTYNNNIYILMMKLGYDDVQSMFHWSLNMDKVTELYTEQIPADGQEQGLYKNYYSYESENSSDENAGIPGTDANDDTTYEIQQGTNTGGSVSTTQIEYLPSERVTNTEYEVGAVIPEESSGSIVCTRVVTYKEDDLRNQGLLDGLSFDEYIAEYDNRQQLEVDDDVYNLVSMATGVPVDQIQVLAYEQPLFIPSEDGGVNWGFYFQILLAALIIGLLLYVVLKGTKPVAVTEIEPELSVEELLATTKEQQAIEDIDLNENSETKNVIDKLVDENPEAVAQLLRNWLNADDWK